MNINSLKQSQFATSNDKDLSDSDNSTDEIKDVVKDQEASRHGLIDATQSELKK